VGPAGTKNDEMTDPDGKPLQWVSAAMPKGSVAIYLGRTLHGAGRNRSENTDRWGLNIDYVSS